MLKSSSFISKVLEIVCPVLAYFWFGWHAAILVILMQVCSASQAIYTVWKYPTEKIREKILNKISNKGRYDL